MFIRIIGSSKKAKKESVITLNNKKTSDITNKFLLAGDIRLKQQKFMYSACVPLIKNKG